jgi:hypothetical protein
MPSGNTAPDVHRCSSPFVHPFETRLRQSGRQAPPWCRSCDSGAAMLPSQFPESLFFAILSRPWLQHYFEDKILVPGGALRIF